MTCKQCGSDLTESAKFCQTCGAPVQTDESTSGAQPRSSLRKVAFIVFPIALIGGILIFIRYINPTTNAVIKEQPVVARETSYGPDVVKMKDITAAEEGGELVFALDELKKNKLVRFAYSGGKTTRYVMAYIAPTGQLVTAISFSDHCGSTEFQIKENKIFCSHCASNWDMITMEAFACCAKYYPDPIPSRVENDKVYISKSFVENWAGRL